MSQEDTTHKLYRLHSNASLSFILSVLVQMTPSKTMMNADRTQML